MDTNHGTVEKHLLEIGILSQLGEDPLPLIIAPIQTNHKFTLSASWANSIMLNVNTT